MRVATFLRRLPWLTSMLVGCSDGSPGGGATGSSTGNTSGAMTAATTSNADESTTGNENATGSTTLGNAETTGSATGGDPGMTGSTTTSDTGTTQSNAAPTAVDDVVYTAQNAALVLDAASGLLGNDTDPDRDTLTVTDFDAVSDAGGTVEIDDDGAITYDPVAGFWGPDAFAYTIGDGSGATASATVTVHVAPTQIPLAEVAAGLGGFSLEGEVGNDRSGDSVSAAGDVNGDGVDDIIVGAAFADPNGGSSGRSYVVFGKADTAAVDHGAITAGTGGFVLDGEAAGDYSGASAVGAGDVNGDGMDDIIVGADGADPNGESSGRSYVVFGKADTTPVQLSVITAGTGGFVLNGEATADFSGGRVSGAGDVNGDGMDDIIIGASRAGPNGEFSGRSYVVFGKASTTPVQLSAIAAETGGFVLDGEAESDFSGRRVSGAGDVNGDGMDDIIVGANSADPNGDSSGRSYVVFGKTGTAAVQLSAITAGMGGFVLNGEAESDASGGSVSGAGDINADGMADIIVGAPWADPNGSNSGRSYVVFGKADTAAVELSNITAGMGGFILNGEAAIDESGRSVSGAGDVNGDGMDDIIVGAFGSDPNGDTSGRSYLVFGKVDTAAVELSAITQGLGGFVLDGEAASDRSGNPVSGAGDVNSDGLGDIIVGAPFADPNGANSGRSYVVFGVPTGEN